LSEKWLPEKSRRPLADPCVAGPSYFVIVQTPERLSARAAGPAIERSSTTSSTL
jgi:hypothetical protein